MSNWSYTSKIRVFKEAKEDLIKRANWDVTPGHLDVLDEILEDLHRLEDLEK